MSELTPKYLVRDPQGNVYGPADEATLRDWVQQGRIVQGMDIAPRETREWTEVSQHPALADLFPKPAARPEASLGTSSPESTYATPDPPATPTPRPLANAQSSVTRIPSPERVTGTVTMTPAYHSVPVYHGSIGLQVNTLGLLGFIAGIFGLVVAACPCGWIVGAPVGLVAITLSGIGLHQIRLNPPRYTGSGMPIAGLVMGILAVFVSLIWFVLFLAGATHP